MNLPLERIRLWWHCLLGLFRFRPLPCRMMEATAGFQDSENYATIWLGCSCGKTFYGETPAWVAEIKP